MACASGEYQQHSFERDLAKLFERRESDLYLIGHHMKFDVHMALNVGIDLRNNKLYCTQNAEALLDEYARSYSLDAVSKKYGGVTKVGDDMYAHLAKLFNVAPDRNSMSVFWQTSGLDPMVTEYAEADAAATINVSKNQVRELRGQDLTKVANLDA